jgi:hypothetical protein
MKSNINFQEVANILSNSSWDYTHNGQRIDEDTMRTLISELEAVTIEPQLVEYFSDNDTPEESEEAARYLADQIGQRLVNCPYETVSFHI